MTTTPDRKPIGIDQARMLLAAVQAECPHPDVCTFYRRIDNYRAGHYTEFNMRQCRRCLMINPPSTR